MGAGLYKMVHEGSSPHGPGMVHEGSSWSLMSSIGPSPIRALALEMTAGDSEFSALLVGFELPYTRVAELGSLSSGAKMAMKIFVKHVFTTFASNASFLRVIANLQN